MRFGTSDIQYMGASLNDDQFESIINQRHIREDSSSMSPANRGNADSS